MTPQEKLQKIKNIAVQATEHYELPDGHEILWLIARVEQLERVVNIALIECHDHPNDVVAECNEALHTGPKPDGK